MTPGAVTPTRLDRQHWSDTHTISCCRWAAHMEPSVTQCVTCGTGLNPKLLAASKTPGYKMPILCALYSLTHPGR